jgi:hypothetical protein
MLSKVYSDEGAPTIALLFAFIKQFGSEALLHDPLLIKDDIEKEYNLTLSELNFDNLCAAIEVLTSNMFEENWNVFETCCHLFSNVPVDTSIVVPLSIEEVVKGIAEAYLIRHEKLEFNGDINLYVGKLAFDYGFSTPPRLFPTAIIPQCPCAESTDNLKNQALQDLFDYHVNETIKFLDSLSEN